MNGETGALLLGIDVGSSSTKGALVRADGSVLREAVSVHAISHPRPGWAEQDPETDWWTGVVAVVLSAASCWG